MNRIRNILLAGLGAGLIVLAWAAQARADEPLADDAVAAAKAIPDRNLLEIVHSGGIMMYPIVICSFILLIFVFERFIALRRGHVVPRPFVKRFLHQLKEGRLNQVDALAVCEENGSAAAQVFAGAARKWGKSSVEVEQGVMDAGERVVNHLRRHMRVIQAVATISPLLGLTGTVFGMIEAFNVIAKFDGMGKQEMLAGGISQALLTTAGGLVVAVPAYLFHAYFTGCVDRRVMELDELGQQAVQQIASDGVPHIPAPKHGRAKREHAGKEQGVSSRD